jgi:hypothetical protein
MLDACAPVAASAARRLHPQRRHTTVAAVLKVVNVCLPFHLRRQRPLLHTEVVTPSVALRLSCAVRISTNTTPRRKSVLSDATTAALGTVRRFRQFPGDPWCAGNFCLSESD